ncbi:MAG: hypothetical protein WDO71_08455 [Bacteroidota bacterium]
MKMQFIMYELSLVLRKLLYGGGCNEGYFGSLQMGQYSNDKQLPKLISLRKKIITMNVVIEQPAKWSQLQKIGFPAFFSVISLFIYSLSR